MPKYTPTNSSDNNSMYYDLSWEGTIRKRFLAQNGFTKGTFYSESHSKRSRFVAKTVLRQSVVYLLLIVVSSQQLAHAMFTHIGSDVARIYKVYLNNLYLAQSYSSGIEDSNNTQFVKIDPSVLKLHINT